MDRTPGLSSSPARDGSAGLFRWVGEAFDDDAGGFEVGDAVVGAVAHEDGLAEESDEGAGFVGEPAAVGLVEVDDEVVGDVAFGTEDGGFEGAVEGGGREFADGVGSGADGCDGEGHLCCQAITGFVGAAAGRVD